MERLIEYEKKLADYDALMGGGRSSLYSAVTMIRSGLDSGADRRLRQIEAKLELN